MELVLAQAGVRVLDCRVHSARSSGSAGRRAGLRAKPEAGARRAAGVHLGG